LPARARMRFRLSAPRIEPKMSKVRSRTWDGVSPCRRASSHWRRHLVCIGLLACARVATSQVVGVGSECHQAEVRDAVARVRAQLPEIERILTELEEAKYECRVFRKTTGTATVDSAAHHAVIAWPGTSGHWDLRTTHLRQFPGPRRRAYVPGSGDGLPCIHGLFRSSEDHASDRDRRQVSVSVRPAPALRGNCRAARHRTP
jgi:hypothetical protein